MSRPLIMLLSLSLVVAACQGASGATTTTVEPTTSATASTTTTTAATTTSAPATTTTESLPDPVDLIFTGGTVVTMDPGIGTVEAIAIDGDTIIAVGSTSEIDRYRGADTTVVDLDGRTVNPGFVDAHTHILSDMGGIEAGQQLALANGLTSVADASVEEGLPEVFIEAADSGMLRVRTSMYLGRTDPCGEDAGTWYEAYAPDTVFNDRLRVAGVKIFADGGVCGSLAMSEPFLEGVGIADPYRGLDALTSMIQRASDAGYQVIIHAQGDLAIAEVQDAYAAVLGGGPNTLRLRIDHNVFPTAETIGRYSELDIVPVLFGSSEACRPDLPWTDFYKEHGERPGDIVAANPDLVIAWHGDDPWATPVSPIYELFSLVTRGRVTDDGSICEPPDWMADGGVSVEQGLAMMTTGSAYAIRQEDLVGSLTPGKYADLLVLSDNLLTVPSDQIPNVELLMTMIGGTTEFCARRAGQWCPGFEVPEVPDVSASLSRADHGPELAFDGSVSGESFWSSGADAPQWIRVDFPEPVSITGIRFVVYQNPPGDTDHQLEALLVGSDWQLLSSYRGFTTTGDVLTWMPVSPLENVEALRMTTVESPSWPEWYEIEIDTGSDG